MYVYIYILYSTHKIDQNSNSQYGKLWLTIKFGGALLLVCLENGEWVPQLRVFFTGNMASVNWDSTPFNSHWLRKSPGIIIPFLKGWRNHKKSYHQPERVWPCIVRSCIPQVIAAERHWALLDIVRYHSPSEFSTPWPHGPWPNGPMVQWWPAFLKQNAFYLNSGVTFL